MSVIYKVPLEWRWAIGLAAAALFVLTWLFAPIFFPRVLALPAATPTPRETYHHITITGIVSQERFLMHYQPTWVQAQWRRWGEPNIYMVEVPSPAFRGLSPYSYFYFSVAHNKYAYTSQEVTVVAPSWWPLQPITGRPLSLDVPSIHK
ncbi:MAG: hypothetical protein ACYCOU_26975 [Sulfobacillus sp.]